MQGLRSITSHIRQGPPDIKDEMWNHISKATDVQACISGNITGADESLMLNLNGFVKTCNSTNFFTVRVRDGEVWAPTKNNQMQGINHPAEIQWWADNWKWKAWSGSRAYSADVYEDGGKGYREGMRGDSTRF